ncbi:hypothetical protein SpCBS45565_g08460 [Spizellomyces sp. 'palustris']|nr:hypothetical protein SpCBS45565_g08460 [Spizellomyces sp. 'palustris']
MLPIYIVLVLAATVLADDPWPNWPTPYPNYQGLAADGTIFPNPPNTSTPFFTPSNGSWSAPTSAFPLPAVGPASDARKALNKSITLRVGVSIYGSVCTPDLDFYAPPDCDVLTETRTATLLAQEEINANPLLLPDAKLEVVFLDNDFPDLTIRSTVTGFTVANPPLSLMMGSCQDSDTMVTAAYTSSFSFPQISVASDSPVFSAYHDNYKYFWRPSSGGQRYVNMALIAQSFNWKQVGIIGGQDQYSTTAAQQLSAACHEMGITVISQLAFKWSVSEKDPTACYCLNCNVNVNLKAINMTTCKRELSSGFAQLKATDLRVFYVLMGGEYLIDPLLIYYTASEFGLVGEDYVWITNLPVNNYPESYMVKNFGVDYLAKSRGLLVPDDAPTMNDETNPPEALQHLLDIWPSFIAQNLERVQTSGSIGDFNVPSLRIRTYYDVFYYFANAVDLILNRQNLTMNEWYSQKLYNNLTIDVWNSTGYISTTGPFILTENGDRVVPSFVYQMDGVNWDTTPVIAAIVDNTVKFQGYPDSTCRLTVPPDHPILELQQVSVHDGLGATFTALYTAAIVVCTASLGTIVLLRKDKRMTKRSPVFIVNILLGLICVLATIYPNVFGTTTQTCVIERWTQGIGFAVVMGNVAAKAYRIWRIFDNAKMKTVSIPNSELLKFSGIIMLIEMILLGIWTGVDFPVVLMERSGTTYRFICGARNETASTILTAIVYACNGFLLCGNAFLAWKTRNVATDYGEAKHIAYTVYNVVVICLIVVPQAYFSTSTSATLAFAVRFSLSLVAIVIAWALLVGSHLYMIFVPPSGDHVNLNTSSIGRGQLSNSITTTSVASLADAATVKYLVGDFSFRDDAKFFSVWRSCQLHIIGASRCSLMIRYLSQNQTPVHNVIELADVMVVERSKAEEEELDTFTIQTKSSRLTFQAKDVKEASSWVIILKALVDAKTPGNSAAVSAT